MAIAQPLGTDFLNSPDHSLLHRIIAADLAAPVQSLVVDNVGKVGIGIATPGATLEVNGNIKLSSADLNCIYFEETNNYLYFEGWQIDSANNLYIKQLNKGIEFYTKNVLNVIFDEDGNVGIGTATPTAYLHLKAGTAAANTAPIKLTAGTLNTTPVAGCIEFDGTNLYFVNSSNVRKQLAVV